jgi:hypothetical protein
MQGLKSTISILWHVDPLLGTDREISDCTAAVARQRSANNRGMVFSAWSSKQQFRYNRGTVFSMLPVPRYYKQDKSRVYSVSQCSELVGE